MKLRFLSLCITLSLLVGCQNETDVKVPQINHSIWASIESSVNESRTAVDNAGNVTWIKSDAIGVFGVVTQNAKFTSTADGGAVTFEGSLTEEGEEIKCVYYPYDETATFDANQLTFTLPTQYTYTGASSAPMLGVKSGDNGYNFKHLCGLMRVSIIGVPVGTSTFTLTSEGENAASIAGTAVVDDVNALDATLALNGNLSNQITVTIEADEMTNAVLYLPLPVGTYSKLSVIYKDETAEYFKKSTSNVTINRGTLLDMPIVATTEKYLDEIDSHVATLDLQSYDYEGFKAYLTTWLGQQEFVADCKNISHDGYEEIEFTTLGGLKSSIILTKSEEEVEPADARSVVPYGDSDKIQAFNVANVSGESIFESTNVKAYTFCKMYVDYQEQMFNEMILSTPVALKSFRLESKSNAIYELLNDKNKYSVVLFTGTHGVYDGFLTHTPTGAFWVYWSGNHEFINKEHIGKLALWYDLSKEETKWNTEGKYFVILPRFFSDNYVFQNVSLLHASYCYSTGSWKGFNLFYLPLNFLGYKGSNGMMSNSTNICSFYTYLFNGYTVANAHTKTNEDKVFGSEDLIFNENKPNQRYFSINSYYSTVDGCYALVHGKIFGWSNLKGRMQYNGSYYKSDVLKYKVYHSDKPFESPLDDGVISQTIGFGKISPTGIVTGHYQPDAKNANTLQLQCLIKTTNVSGKKCYFAIGFEYTDDYGNVKIYYGNIASYTTR